jgi:flagellin-specific chaperone FliS
MAAAIQIRSARRPRSLQACDAAPLSVMHFESALRSLILAGETLGMGTISSCHLRTAITQIRKLCATLALQADRTMAANLADLTEYMCRELRGVATGTAGPAKLADICELLREIRCAWVTAPCVAPTLSEGAGRATYLM